MGGPAGGTEMLNRGQQRGPRPGANVQGGPGVSGRAPGQGRTPSSWERLGALWEVLRELGQLLEGH